MKKIFKNSFNNPILFSKAEYLTRVKKPKTKMQENNIDVEIGSYPFFKSDKVGVAIVLRSEDESKISICNNQILKFINSKKIQLIDKD